MTREKERLPDERNGVTHHFAITDRHGKTTDGYLTTGEYSDGRLGELFLKVGKPGDETAWLDAWALAVSVALQHGAPVDAIFGKFTNMKFEPRGSTMNTKIPRTSSPCDYVAKFCLEKYGAKS